MVENIINEDKLCAVIIKANYSKDGIDFFTPPEFTQQLGYMKRPKGHVIEPHVHNLVPREIFYTQEVLFVRKGRVQIDFYNDDKEYFGNRILHTGDVILLASGGHGLTMLEETEIIEVKQGPFMGDKDKVRFTPSEPQI